MAQTDFLDKAERTEQGLKINGLILEQIVESCEGCERIKEIQGGRYCTSFAKPSGKWRHGACNFATHIKASVDKEGKVKVNPLKASKRAARRKK